MLYDNKLIIIFAFSKNKQLKSIIMDKINQKNDIPTTLAAIQLQ